MADNSGFKLGGWYNGQQYGGDGSFSAPGQFNPAVSGQSGAAPVQNAADQAYINSNPSMPTSPSPTPSATPSWANVIQDSYTGPSKSNPNQPNYSGINNVINTARSTGLLAPNSQTPKPTSTSPKIGAPDVRPDLSQSMSITPGQLTPGSTAEAQHNLNVAKTNEGLQADRDKSINDVTNKVLKLVPPQAQGMASHTIPQVIQALRAEGILTPQTLAYALATIQRETGGTFQSVREGFSDEVGRQQAIKNNYAGGANYYGRGLIQLTGLPNYQAMGQRIGVDLANNPDLALQPDVSAKILAAFMKDRGVADLANQGDFVGARGPVNGTDQAFNIANTAKQYLAEIPYNLQI